MCYNCLESKNYLYWNTTFVHMHIFFFLKKFHAKPQQNVGQSRFVVNLIICFQTNWHRILDSTTFDTLIVDRFYTLLAVWPKFWSLSFKSQNYNLMTLVHISVFIFFFTEYILNLNAKQNVINEDKTIHRDRKKNFMLLKKIDRTKSCNYQWRFFTEEIIITK